MEKALPTPLIFGKIMNSKHYKQIDKTIKTL